MTVVINHDMSSVIWCAPGYGKEVLSQFFELLSQEQRASIHCVSADGARWVASCVEKYCPNAQRCIDPFHVVSWATDALDQVRREAWTEAHRQAESQPKRKPGRPAKGEPASDKKQAKTVKSLFVGLPFLTYLTARRRTNTYSQKLSTDISFSHQEIPDIRFRAKGYCELPYFLRLNFKNTIKTDFLGKKAIKYLGAFTP